MASKERAVNIPHIGSDDCEKICMENETPLRIWMDGSFDMVHNGHLIAFQKARELGTSLTVGVQSDADIISHKGPPVYTEYERCRLVASLKIVDQFIGTAPYGTTSEILDKYKCDVCAHGADTTLITNPNDPLKKLGDRLRLFHRGINMSTTNLINRILNLTKALEEGDDVSSLRQDDLFFGTLLCTSSFISNSCQASGPKPGDKIVYVSGAFDLFHIGHLEFLEKAAALGDYLIVGVYHDHVVNEYKGPIYPILPLPVRAQSVLAIKCVSDVIFGAPYVITSKIMEFLKIDLVCHGSASPIQSTSDGADPFAEPKQQGRFQLIDSGSCVTTQTIVDRISNRREEYEARNKKKFESERIAAELIKESLVGSVQFQESFNEFVIF